MTLVKFMTSPVGRGLRIVLGTFVIAVGLLVVGGTMGTIMSIVGIIPLAGGLLDYCIISAVLGYGFWGLEARARVAGKVN